MSDQVLEREIIARPPVRHASLSRRQLGLAGAALLIGIGAAWYGHHWWTVGRFIESTDDAYVGGDVTVIAPEGGRLHRRGGGHRQPGGACRRPAGEARRPRLPGRAGEGGRRGRRAAGDAGESRRHPPAAGGDDRAGAGRADRDRGRDRPREVRRRSLSQPGAGSVPPRCSASSRRMPTTRRRWPPMPEARAALEAAQRQLDVIDTQKQQTAGGAGRRDRRSRHRAAQPRLHRTARADRRHGRQSQRAHRRLCARSARSSSRWCRRTGSGSMPTSRRASSPACAPGMPVTIAGRRAARRGVPRPCRAAWRRRPARCSACCRRRTPPATSPRSCSACRCACCSTAMPRRWAGCGPGLSVTAAVDER